MSISKDEAKKKIEEGVQQIEAYRNAMLTACGLLITLPFLAESILVAFGHFTRLGIILVTLPMVGSAISFSLTMYLVIGAYRRLAQAAGVDVSLNLILVGPEDLLRNIPLNTREKLAKDLDELVEIPYKFRQSSAKWFSRSEVAFSWGVLFLIVSLIVLALNLVF